MRRRNTLSWNGLLRLGTSAGISVGSLRERSSKWRIGKAGYCSRSRETSSAPLFSGMRLLVTTKSIRLSRGADGFEAGQAIVHSHNVVAALPQRSAQEPPDTFLIVHDQNACAGRCHPLCQEGVTFCRAQGVSHEASASRVWVCKGYTLASRGQVQGYERLE
jgi:hypothetical protein